MSLKARRIPFHIRQKVDDALDNLLRDDIIETIPDRQPTPWVSPIVVVAQKDNSVRLCIDMRKPNSAIKRTRYPIPTVSDIDVLLNGSSYFSKLDVRQAFHQLPLHETSRYITTFCTHRGLFRYKRLNFGTNAASEIFQHVLESHLSGLPGVKNIHDDIIIFGKTRNEHDIALKACLKRLSDIGITLKESKCKFLQTEISFFGQIYSKEGIRPDPERIRDIINLEAPSTIRDIRSFLGMLNYCSKFINDFSTLTHPLREIIKQNKFTWNATHQQAFDILKGKLTAIPVMSYFDLDKETKLVVDASPFGISGILMQKQKHTDDYRTIAYGSRSLTEVEKRYSQTEREGLAIIWGVEHFHQYLYGGMFTIITDHKPYEHIYGRDNSTPSARIERWVLRLQPYRFKVEFRNGKDNPADYMSRHPSAKYVTSQEDYTEQHINFIVKHSIPKALKRSEIIEATITDSCSGKLKDAIMSNNWDSRNLDAFRRYAKEFIITTDGLILKNNKIFIPEKIKKKSYCNCTRFSPGIDKNKITFNREGLVSRYGSVVEGIIVDLHTLFSYRLRTAS